MLVNNPFIEEDISEGKSSRFFFSSNPGRPKGLLMITDVFRLLLFQINQLDFLFQGFNRELYMKKVFQWKANRFYSFCWNPDSERTAEFVFLETSRYSNYYLSKPFGFTSFNKFSIISFLLMEERDDLLFDFLYCRNPDTVVNVKNC